MILSELLDISLLEERITQGFVTRRYHPYLPYAILNYTDKCTYDRQWDDVTRKCRGLIYQVGNGEVLARPFEKIFNLGEPDAPEVDLYTVGEVLDKADGSLGILYPTAFGWAVATRGSFESDQAKWATKKLQEYLDDGWEPTDGLTYLVEIVFPANRIVLDYGDTEALVLLATLDTETGVAYPLDQKWPDQTVEQLGYGVTLQEAMSWGDRENREGFVFRPCFSNTRIKVKQEDYVLKHRIVFGLNARSVWEVLRVGSPDGWNEFVEHLPEEFQGWADDVSYLLTGEVTRIRMHAYEDFYNIEKRLGPEYTRKDFAQLALTYTNHHLLFRILDGKPIDDETWKMVYPAADWRPTGGGVGE
jgi:RNA ligase